MIKRGMNRFCSFFSLFLLVFFSITQGAWGEFNVFRQRRVIVGEFRNRTDEVYDYIEESIRNNLYSYALFIPFLTLSDEERSFLERLREEDESQDALSDYPTEIGYRMEPKIELADGSSDEGFPLSIYGDYTVYSEERVLLNIGVYNYMTDSLYGEYSTELDLYSLLSEPREYLVPFFKMFLRYKTYQVSISGDPEGALVFLDNRLIGIGSTSEILVPPGRHRITVKKDGYTPYSDIVTIDEEHFTMNVSLKRSETETISVVDTTPQGAEVYVDEKYVGQAPTHIQPQGDFSTLTLKAEGYTPLTISRDNLPQSGQLTQVNLIQPSLKEKFSTKAERHRKTAKLLYYSGIGMLGVSILLGIEKTLNTQKADLYRGVDEERYDEALNKEKQYAYLAASSSAITVTLFTVSFIEMVNYFRKYSRALRAE